MGRVKAFLKKILPPTMNAFEQKIESLQAMNRRLNEQVQQQQQQLAHLQNISKTLPLLREEMRLQSQTLLRAQTQTLRNLPQEGMTHPKVSVIIPVYNTEKYLRKCIASVLQQTLREIEVICVNDGTTDGSLAILEEYAQSDCRVCVISQENSGLSAARNTGLRAAVGDYVYFLDSDDFLELNALQISYTACEKERLDILFFGRIIFWEDEQAKNVWNPNYAERSELTEVLDGVAFYRKTKAERTYSSQMGIVLLNRAFMLANQLYFYNGILHEDELFMFSAFMEAKRVFQLKDKLYHRLIRTDSIMTVPKSAKNLIGYSVTLQQMLKYQNACCWDAEKLDAIQCAVKDMKWTVKNIAQTISEAEKEIASQHAAVAESLKLVE